LIFKLHSYIKKQGEAITKKLRSHSLQT